MADISTDLAGCLFFTSSSLARVVGRMADEEFSRIGVPASEAFLLMLAAERPGIAQKDLAACLHLAPSTVSRFVDALVRRGLVEKHSAGKSVEVSATEEGWARMPEIVNAWNGLHGRYSGILGKERGEQLTSAIHAACDLLADYD